jgi:RNA polymerase subunit RPABC4/transcription elongation factor Spt4
MFNCKKCGIVSTYEQVHNRVCNFDTVIEENTCPFCGEEVTEDITE